MTLTSAEKFARLLEQYRPGSGNNRYARFCEDVLGLDRTEVFDQIAQALDNNSQTLVIGGNGLGKSYGTSALAIAALYCNANTVVPVTAGNGDTVKNSIWKNVLSLWKNSDLPGDFNKSDRSIKTGFDAKWFLECHSPANAEDLEGDHNNNVIYIIEEAEKPGVTDQHIDSARSTLAEDDPILVLCNPPVDESNVVHQLEQKDSWEVLRFPTWESRNSLVDRGLTDKPKIGGLSGVGKMRGDWEEYHDEPWPGVDAAINVSSKYLTENGKPTVRAWEAAKENPDFRDDLHQKWYKRRVGITPPDGSEKWRPWSISDVEKAYKRDIGRVRNTPEALGIDVADKVDTTKAIGLHEQKAIVEYDSQADLPVQQNELIEKINNWPTMDGRVDAIGRGAQLAQELETRFPDFAEFGSNEVPVDDQYRSKWAHGLQLIGEWLRGGGSFEDGKLYEELKIGARVLEFNRNHLRSRGKVIEATPKEELKKRVGRSPDTTDALLMALYARETDSSDGKASATWGW